MIQDPERWHPTRWQRLWYGYELTVLQKPDRTYEWQTQLGLSMIRLGHAKELGEAQRLSFLAAESHMKKRR